jgi:HK97 family phage major capsid protein
MTEKFEEVMAKIAELTQAIKEHQNDATFDKEAMNELLTKAFEDQRIALADNVPVRAGAPTADPIQRAAYDYKGKYRRELMGIAQDGKYKVGNWELRGSDLIFAKHLIDNAVERKARGEVFHGSDGIKPASDDLNAVVKTLTATGSATGDELVPTGMAAELWQDFFARSLIAADLPTIPMPTDPFDLPLGFGDITWRKGTGGQATTSTNMATAKSALTSTEQVAEVDWTYDLDEDAVVAVMPALRARLAISGAEQMDNFCINADATATSTGNINLDDDTPPATSWYLTAGQDGIRHQFIVDKSTQAVAGAGAALSDAMMSSMLNLLGKYALDVTNLRIVPGAAVYQAMVGLTNVATVDKYGGGATILRGELARYRGIPILPSASMPLGEADGKVCKTAASNTLGVQCVYNRTGWNLGYRRGLMIEVDRNIQTRQLIMVVSFRIAIAAYGTRSTAQHTAGIINILLS